MPTSWFEGELPANSMTAAATEDFETKLSGAAVDERRRAKVREMEAEAERLRHDAVRHGEKPMAGSSVAMPTAVLTDEERLDTDSRSVYAWQLMAKRTNTPGMSVTNGREGPIRGRMARMYGGSTPPTTLLRTRTLLIRRSA
uniref:DUF1707 domain-containing protein n=1 Tax=Macrostomum lignano TaxID=282301 RepID=A0A1I8FC54_9PLAT